MAGYALAPDGMRQRPIIRSLLVSLPVLLCCGTAPVHAQSPSGEFSPAALRTLVDRVAANQHRNDDALELFERIERRVMRQASKASSPGDDKAWRVIPWGTGNIRLLIEDAGKPVDAALYHKQLREVVQSLDSPANSNPARLKQEEEKSAHRKRERASLVDAAKDAFIYTFLGRESRNARTLLKFSAEPNPNYKPASRNTSFFANVRAIAWLDEASSQIVRFEAEIFKDISVGGGIIGKVYRGGRFVLEQEEVAPGIWLPTLYQFDFDGRKFLFSFDVHETTTVSRYRRVGPLNEALVTLRRELSSGSAPAASRGDP
jgi:hypothetical protein